MATVESFSTAAPDPRRKFTCPDDRGSGSFSAWAFEAGIVRAAFGELSFAEVRSQAQTVRHPGPHVARSRSSLFFLHLQMDGQSIHRQDGREALLHAGDFTLCEIGRAHV